MALAMLKEIGWPPGSEPIRPSVEDAGRSRTERTIFQIDLLRQLGQVATGGRLRMMALKGPALSMWLYGNPCIRESFDLDILVAPADLPALEAAITALGLVHIDPVSGFQSAWLQRFFKNRRYLDPKTGLVVECHWRLFDNPYLLPVDFDTLWASRVEVVFGGDVITILSGPLLVLYLLCHAAQHDWSRLKWLGDLFLLLWPMSAEEFRTLRSYAERLRVAHLLACLILLLNELPDHGLPLAWGEWARAERRTRPLMARARAGLMTTQLRSARLAAAETSFSLDNLLHGFALQTGGRFWWFQCLYVLHCEPDWRSLPLPDWLTPLHFLLRPFRWALRHSLDLWRKT